MNRHITAAVLTALLSVSAVSFAAEPAAKTTASVPPAVTVEAATKSQVLKDCSLYVEGKKLDTTGLPAAALKQNKTVLIPLRKVSDALGYTLTWIPEKTTARMDMSIASMDFKNGVNEYKRQGKLKAINLDQTFKYDAAPEIINGVTYVPADVFGAFFNDVSVADKTVKITVQKAELQKASDAFQSAAEAKPIDSTTSTAAAGTETSTANPMVAYKSVSDMEKKLGYSIPVPAALKNKTADAYYLISDETAQINYKDGSMYRVAKTSKQATDISGDYTKYAVDKSWLAGEQKIRGRGEKDAYKLLTWDDNGFAHSYASAQALTKKEATKLVTGH
ncbi:MAG: copper amine oxidase N-terminal domain-containing protein [Acidaminococcus sp.]|jgi:hypothetical protein|nr:copper amine oxidase N-terminal domain-containing protein [Acidaminococcus sp.]MCI2114218.1 copper amine oxidase N-terminal domain-containing protein [Acidaminococcus sp.]MCI2116153.1 copper amine oxidase N-terminal domain-containing protein [Acidaminococcus sp.]